MLYFCCFVIHTLHFHSSVAMVTTNVWLQFHQSRRRKYRQLWAQVFSGWHLESAVCIRWWHQLVIELVSRAPSPWVLSWWEPPLGLFGAACGQGIVAQRPLLEGGIHEKNKQPHVDATVYIAMDKYVPTWGIAYKDGRIEVQIAKKIAIMIKW